MTGKRVLVIEDQPATRELFEEVLGNAGYDVPAGELLASQIGQASTEQFDLIILDLGLPGINGQDVAGSLKKSTNTPILVVSGQLEPTTIKELQAARVTLFLPKPFTNDELVSRVDATVR